MTETLTGKAALLAILEGTHWWVCRYRDGTLSGYFAFLKGRVVRKRNTFEAEVLGGPMQYIDDYNVKMLASGDLRWTRGKPVEDTVFLYRSKKEARRHAACDEVVVHLVGEYEVEE